MVDRRDLLATIAGSGITLIAGCLGEDQPGAGGDHDDENGGQNGDDEGEEKPEISHQVELVEVADDPTQAPLEFEITFTSTTLSSSEMPRFELSIRNNGDEEHILDVGGRNYVVPTRSDPEGLQTILGGEADQIIDVVVDGDGYEENVVGPNADPTGCLTAFDILRTMDYRTHRFDPGEEQVKEYALAGDADDQDCPDKGVYDMYMTVSWDTRDDDDDADWEEFEWGFTIELS